MDDCRSLGGSSRGGATSSRSAGSSGTYHSRASSRRTASSCTTGGESRSTTHHHNLKLVDNLYLDTKTNMLEIIKEGLQLKLEIKSIKEQFLSLLQNYDQFDHQTGTMPKGVLADVAPGNAATTPKELSAARARVRALYDAKKKRLRARCSAISGTGSGGGKLTPSVVKGKKHRAYHMDDEEDKENIAVGRLPPQSVSSQNKVRNKHRNAHPPPPSVTRHRHAQLVPSSSSGKLLTPIKEESRNSKGSSRASSRTTSRSTSPVITDVEGEYVTLKPPSTERCGNYMNISPEAPFQSIQEQCDTDDTSLWINTNDDLGRFSPKPNSETSFSVLKGVSPIQNSAAKYATSDAISELYTSKSLKDLSHISRISHSSIHEQVSGTNLNVSGGQFHSTFNYPLHSTLQYPLNSTIAMDLPDDITFKSSADELEKEGSGRPGSAQSDPDSVIIRSRSLSPHSASMHDPQQAHRYLDDSYMDNFRVRPPVNNNNNGENVFKLPRPPTKRQRVKKTPQTQVPILCKEHGLHPNLGGPCIFQTDDSFTLTDDDSQDELGSERRRNSSKAVTETDCDSSYLSECMDNESQGGLGFSEAEEMTATYDARNGRMKILRRQTGQTALQDKSHLRSPIGLSESDFLDVTRKHFSMEATRASLPDLSALSTAPSEAEVDNSESTLHASRLNNTVRENSDHKSGATPPTSLNSTLVSGETVNQNSHRPLSVATTSTSNTSPDSNTGCQVPANSPNITDTNSSSRQNTDNYDYVEVPIKKHVVREQMEQQQAARAAMVSGHAHSHPRRSRRLPNTSRSTCTLYSNRRERDGDPGHCSSSGGGANTAARKCLHYHHDCDSGFSTPVSKRACANNTTTHGRHITITDTAGSTRTVVQHSAVARNLQKERKRQLVKKLKQFNSNFHTAQSTGNLQNIKTLGHF